MDPRTRQAFDAEMPKIHKRALARAVWHAHRFGIAARGSRHAGDDLLNDVVQSMLEGDRNWDPTKVDLLKFLDGATKSLAWSRRKTDRKEPARCGDVPITDMEDSRPLADLRASPREVPNEQDLEVEQHSQLVDDALAVAKDDPMLESVVFAVIDGAGTRDAVAKQLGKEKDDVYDASRKLKRRYLSLRRPRPEET